MQGAIGRDQPHSGSQPVHRQGWNPDLQQAVPWGGELRRYANPSGHPSGWPFFYIFAGFCS